MCDSLKQFEKDEEKVKITFLKLVLILSGIVGIGVISISISHWYFKYYDFGNLMLGIIIGLNLILFPYLLYRIEKKYEQTNKEVLSMIKWKENH